MAGHGCSVQRGHHINRHRQTRRRSSAPGVAVIAAAGCPALHAPPRPRRPPGESPYSGQRARANRERVGRRTVATFTKPRVRRRGDRDSLLGAEDPAGANCKTPALLVAINGQPRRARASRCPIARKPRPPITNRSIASAGRPGSAREQRGHASAPVAPDEVAGRRGASARTPTDSPAFTPPPVFAVSRTRVAPKAPAQATPAHFGSCPELRAAELARNVTKRTAAISAS